MTTKEPTRMVTGEEGEHTVRAILWPDRNGTYWVASHIRGSGYSPINDYGRNGVLCVLDGRKVAEELGVPFVSEVGINTEADA